ncbi:MAG: hypothetical protein Fur0037_00420 [Planctomycetota bacterium]
MDPDQKLEDLTRRLRDCLSRIEEAAFRCQTEDDPMNLEAAEERLSFGAEELGEVVDSLIDAVGRSTDAAHSDLNMVVRRAIREEIEQSSSLLTVRSSLGQALESVGLGPSILIPLVRRALRLAMDHTGPGGEVMVSTRMEEGVVVLEFSAPGRDGSDTKQRIATLVELIHRSGGMSRVDFDRHGDLELTISLPGMSVPGDS